jgi:hypothetical protein
MKPKQSIHTSIHRIEICRRHVILDECTNVDESIVLFNLKRNGFGLPILRGDFGSNQSFSIAWPESVGKHLNVYVEREMRIT